MNQSIHEELDNLINSFIKKWLPHSYAHLVDTDENDGEKLRQEIRYKISQAIKEERKELKDKIENQFDYIIKMVADNRVSFEDSLEHEYVDTCIPYKAVEKSRRIVLSILEEK